MGSSKCVPGVLGMCQVLLTLGFNPGLLGLLSYVPHLVGILGVCGSEGLEDLYLDLSFFWFAPHRSLSLNLSEFMPPLA